ncbi:hypothetical protein [Lacibacter sp. H407]|uniref:hypothetical protein n=1 Tax=Lacibacter sp. H407 TaxID=3133423 RepID=UPI0030BD7397
MIQSIDSHKVKSLKLFLLILCITCFVVSLFLLPFTIFGDNAKPWPIGLWCFLFGWLTVGKVGGISWLANPLLILSWFMFKRNIKVAIGLSFASTIFCSSFLFFDEVVINEAGLSGKIASTGIGYYFWLASSISTFASTIIILIFQNKQPFIHPHKLDS